MAEAQFKAVIQEGAAFFRQNQYAAARSRFESARGLAAAARRSDLAAKAIGNIGGCEFAVHAYQAALRSYLDARRISDSMGDSNTVAMLDANIASLYAQMGELDSAVQWLRGSLQRVSGESNAIRSQMEIEMGSLLARQAVLKTDAAVSTGDSMQSSLAMFRQGIDRADRAGDPAAYALGWHRLGEELLRKSDLAGAERALLEAYRVRKLNRLPLDGSYWDLGELRLAQGDLSSASSLLDRAVELSESAQGPLPKWHVFDARGRVRMAQGRLREAMNDFRIALRLARVDRWSAPAADATRIGAEGILARAYSDLIEAGNRLYFETRDPVLIRETFEAAEENRANSLRQLVQGRLLQTAELPPRYWEAMARLQRAEIAALRIKNAATQSAVSDARAELVGMEASLLPDARPLPGRLTERSQAALRSDTVLLSFHLGRSISWLWALDRGSLMLYALPPRKDVEEQVRAATKAINSEATGRDLAGAALYRTLFGELAPRFQSKSHWLLALDEALLDAPIPALPESGKAVPAYLVEHHAIEVIPGAGYWLESRARQMAFTRSDVFIGIGDPIYNMADSRAVRRSPAVKVPLGLGLFAASGQNEGPSLALPRLVGSDSELEQCALAWQGEHVLLKGADASRHKLLQQLERRPAVVHFATHVLESSQRPTYGLIALSLNDRSETELLQPIDISRWKIDAGLVVLSGCHSAMGATLPGTGLLGLTRAWLIAGAQSVLASHWATPDDDGKLFRAFYRTLSRQSRADPVEALRLAQLEMIRSGDFRAQPRYWGSFFVVGNQ